MRLITYDRGGARRLGAWVGETVVDLPEAVGHPAFPSTMEALVQHIGGSILETAQDILDDEEIVGEYGVASARLLPTLVPSPNPITVLTDGGVGGTLRPRCFAAGVACIIGGASKARRMSPHESRIFGYTLVAHWLNGEDGASDTSLGPAVVTAEEVDAREFRLHLRIDGEPSGERTLEAPNQVFGRLLLEGSRDRPFRAGEIAAWMGWVIGGGKARPNQLPRSVELFAEPIGVLRAERATK